MDSVLKKQAKNAVKVNGFKCLKYMVLIGLKVVVYYFVTIFDTLNKINNTKRHALFKSDV
tara:strand:+ start:3250 stop:3429 length:180 start_codon:yes stop_codon:yes gene_type:complete